MASIEKVRKKLYNYMENIDDEKNLNAALKIIKGYMNDLDGMDLNNFYRLIIKKNLCSMAVSRINIELFNACLNALRSNDTEFINYIKNNRILLENPEINNRLNKILSNKSIYDKAAIISYIGMYNDIIEEVFKTHDENSIRRILKNYNNSEYEEMAIKKALEYNKNFLRDLADYYARKNDLKNLRFIMDELIKNNVDNVSHYFYILGDYENAIKYAKNDDKEIADSYFRTGMLLKALDIYINIFRNYDRSVLMNIIEIEHELKNYREMNIYIDIYERENGLNKKIMLYKIDGFIYTGKYDLAVSYAEKYIENFGLDKDITMERIKIYDGLKDYSMLYSACMDAYNNNIRNDYIYSNIIKYYYYNMDYNEIIKFIEENNLEQMFPGYYISSKIYLGYDVNYNYIDRHVLNAVFATYRSDEKLKLNNDPRINAIVSFMRGEPLGGFNDCSSSATCYISNVRSFDFDPKKVILNNLNPRYNDVYDIISTIRDIVNGHFETDNYDSEFFIYPFINTLLRLKRYDLALLELQKVNGSDPFYYYFAGKYYYIKNDFNRALKFIEKSLSMLKNSYFIALEIMILIKLENYDEALKYMDLSYNLGLYNTFNILYSMNNIDLNIDMIEHIKNLKYPGIYRILRGFFFKNKKIRESIKYSAMILKESGSLDDYLYHYSILKSLNNDAALSFLIKNSIKYNVFYALISRIYYQKRDLEDFIINYNNYISAKRPENINIEYKISIKKNLEYLDYYFNERGMYRDLLYLYIFENKFTDIIKNMGKFIENNLIYDILDLWCEPSVKRAVIDYSYKKPDRKIIYMCIKRCTGSGQVSMASRLYKKTGDIKDSIYLSSIMFRHGLYKELFKFLISNYIRYKNDVFLILFYAFSFRARNFNGIINAYSNGIFIERREIIINVIKSMSATLKTDDAIKTIEKYSYLFNEDDLNNLRYIIENYRRFSRIIDYAGVLFKYEYDHKKRLNREDASVAIPENYIDPVFSFIESDDFYMYREDEFYINIIKNIKTDELSINSIYHYVNDVILAKDVYLYIKMEPVSQYT
ncbi:tetratricopeptide repeat protein [Picrophilus oshimae]|uniref:TPR-repeat-containing protein n=1 Tax=Picrophilus torridus (strain ATCC 700027 / DSM 9790 / JCM 10055 / NBRC 100828 / KAW 2/3) TaxID=1122961 RepID=Q6L2Q9_PICTO|nr:hypothetical protein [Picrophilus oshimae]AAT42743.1 TPR-repeat-containing protein [Picrophilus oshimae DSM 9789]